MRMKLCAGVAGAGAMGRNHARVFSLLEGVDLVAIYDRDKALADSVAAEFGAVLLIRWMSLLRLLTRLLLPCRLLPTER